MAKTSDRAAALREQAERGYPESWKPEKAGEGISGTFLRLETATTGYGPSLIVVIAEETTGQERGIWCFHTALRSQFQKAQPQPGEFIYVLYKGKVTSKDGKQTYHDWAVAVDRDPADAGPVNWNIGDDAGYEPMGTGIRDTDNTYIDPATVTDEPIFDDDVPF